jgi:hypothetical protein
MSSQHRRTLAELRSAVRKRVPVSENDTQITYDVIDEAINSALKQVSVEHNWPWLLKSVNVSTTSGTDTVPVPVDWLATKLVVITATASSLQSRHLEELLVISSTTTGQPTLFAVDEENVLLRPVPDAVYVMNHVYYRSEPTIAGDLAKPLIPQGYDEGVIEYAAYLILRYKREDNRALAAMKAYNDWLDRTRDNLMEAKSPRAPKVRPGNLL